MASTANGERESNKLASPRVCQADTCTKPVPTTGTGSKSGFCSRRCMNRTYERKRLGRFRKPPVTVKCAWIRCDQTFEKNGDQQKFCSRACSVKANNARKSEDRRPLQTRECTECKTIFLPKNSRQKCCSSPCTSKRSTRLRREAWEKKKRERTPIETTQRNGTEYPRADLDLFLDLFRPAFYRIANHDKTRLTVVGEAVGHYLGIYSDGGRNLIQELLDGQRTSISHHHADALLLACGSPELVSHVPAFPTTQQQAKEMVEAYYADEEPDELEHRRLEKTLLRFSRGWFSADEKIAEVEREAEGVVIA